MILMKVVVTTDNDIPAENRNTFPVMITSTAKADTHREQDNDNFKSDNDNDIGS